ncbi:MAG: hypothetical protein LBU90_08555 [Bacteroidales bacterium]|jgi:hypothetical protein|nr:hypothetical protein [Bacteroidales bacterium]
MKKKHIPLIIIACIILIAIFTNPNQEQHKEAVKNKVNYSMQKNMNGSNDGFAAFGAILSGAIAGAVVDNLVSSNNYLLFSTTVVTWQGEAKVIGVGLFGNVFLSPKFDEVLSNELLNQYGS